MNGLEVWDISGTERDRIIGLEEGHYADLKARQIEPAKLSQTVSAFANTGGGDLYVGIREIKSAHGGKIRQWDGFDDQEAVNGHLQGLTDLFPLGTEFTYSYLRSSGSPGLVLHIAVQRTRQVVEARNGIPFIRVGAQNIPVNTAKALERLRLDKGIQTFETQPVSVDLSIVTEGEALRLLMDHLGTTSSPDVFVRRQVMAIADKPVVAAVLLFADEPQAALPKRSAIKLYRYKTSAAEGTRDTLAGDPISIEGPLHRLIPRAVGATVDLVEGIQRLGPTGLEPIKYPYETLHEIVTNAVLHRDYSIAADVHIRVFDNRIEVESPGVLPGHVTPNNILQEQFARNAATVRLINKFPDAPNKDVGEGLNTAFNAMKMLRLKPPVILETQSSVVVVIRHDPLASPEEAVMDYLANHEWISNRIGRELTGISSENTMKDVFIRLRERRLIEQFYGGKKWRKRV